MHDLLETTVSCPYCGETIDVLIDCSSGSQQYYQDCSVCCATILFTMEIDSTDKLTELIVSRDDE